MLHPDATESRMGWEACARLGVGGEQRKVGRLPGQEKQTTAQPAESQGLNLQEAQTNCMF